MTKPVRNVKNKLAKNKAARPLRHVVIASPVGALTLVSSASGLVSLRFGQRPPEDSIEDRGVHARAIFLLEEYFRGNATEFELPIDPGGTPFQRAVWSELRRIPWGETRTYGEIARAVGRPGAARAVGTANNRNPIAIVVPCHRVIGSDGRLTGYAAGLHVKSRLLSLESRHADAFPAIASTESTATSHSRGRVTGLRAAV